MKIDKYILTFLCAGVCVWSAKMVAGVIGLGLRQGPGALLALLEISAFVGAGLIPALMVWLSPDKKWKWVYAVWAVCIIYVLVLALNYARFDLLAGAIRFALWISILVLFIHVSKHQKPA